jgi:hypothetical protein
MDAGKIHEILKSLRIGELGGERPHMFKSLAEPKSARRWRVSNDR